MQTFLTNLWVQTISVFIRATLLIWGAATVERSSGLITPDMAEQVIGALMIIFGTIWSLAEKFVVNRFFKALPFQN